MTSIEAALDKIAARRPRIIDLSLDRVHAALERLGNPHHRLPPVFHIAGTNGKGSTLAFLRAVFEADGKSVHSFISPHLVRFNERIVLGGKEIDDAALLDVFARVDRAVGDEKLTYFETITCAAFLAFSEAAADALLLEVGLGGRLDATNVLKRPLASLVTPVDYDHQKFLGDTLAAIATEKAGIFRAGTPAVIGRQRPEAMAVLLERAEAIGAHQFAFGRDWDAYRERGRLIYQDNDGLLDIDAPRLAGVHQFDNAGLAIAALRATQRAPNDRTLSKGIATAHWPGRLQRLTEGPIVDQVTERLSDGVEIWLDGGHNPHAGAAVARAMADMEERRPNSLVLIAGMQANKDAVGYFQNFSGLARKVYAVAADHSGVAPATEVAAAAREAGLAAEPFASIDKAIECALGEQKNEPPRFLICGSLYLAGEVLKQNA